METKAKFRESSIDGVKIFISDVYQDGRGQFVPAFDQRVFSEQFVADNLSYSLKGSFRGLHIQRNNPQGKLVRCIEGVIMDYFLDLRPESPTFKKLDKIYMRSPDIAIYLPPGIAHGFFSVTDSIVYYKCTTPHDPKSDGGVCYNDPEIGLFLPGNLTQISTKDANLPSLMDYLKET